MCCMFIYSIAVYTYLPYAVLMCIRCMAAKQRLTKGRMRARHLKMQRIAVLIGLPENAVEDPFANNYMLNTGVIFKTIDI